MRALMRTAVVTAAPALLALAGGLVVASPAARSGAAPYDVAFVGEVGPGAHLDAHPGAHPDAHLDAHLDAHPGAHLDASKSPPYPPTFDAGKPKLDAAIDAHKSPSDAPRPIPPDPTPLVVDAFFVLTVRFDKGTVSIAKTRREKLAAKSSVDRRFGRYAFELYSGPTLVERVRFDFPLVHDDSVASDVYEKSLVVEVDVKIPDSDRPNKLELWDRATDRRWLLEYPPR